MRLIENPPLPSNPDSPYAVALNQQLVKIFQSIATKVNQIGDGKISGSDLVAVSVPTTGTFGYGDFIRNSDPVEAGTAGSKYVIVGWLAQGGSPGTFLQCRFLTGN